MERFVFVAAVTVAIIFGVVSVFGGPHWDMDFDVDARGMDAVVETSAGRLEPQTFAGGELRIKHSAANIVITPEDRTDIVVEIDNPGRLPMPTVSVDEGRVVIDGQLRGRIHDCRGDTVDVRGYGEYAAADLPRIVVRTPRNLSLSWGGAGTAEIGATQSLEADFSGCGDATIGDVAENLSLDVSGSGEVRGGAAQNLSVDLAGSGEVQLGAIANGANVDIAGSGEIVIASLTGSLEADSAGSGALRVEGGAVTDMNVDLAGSGDVSVAASVTRLEVSIVGSGDVDVAGAVGDIDADIAGSGSVSAQSVSGNVRKQVWGSGNVHVGG